MGPCKHAVKPMCNLEVWWCFGLGFERIELVWAHNIFVMTTGLMSLLQYFLICRLLWIFPV